MNRTMASALLLMTAFGGAAGCGAQKPQRMSDEDLSAVWLSSPPTPATPAVQPMPVKEGEAPLAYWLESGAVVRVADVQEKLDVARGFVPGRSIVRVDARNGVVFGRETVYPGPLRDGRRYVIYVEPDRRNVSRHEVVQPRPRRRD
jgi:hypothetical protein